MIDFRTEPARYRHWSISLDGPVATLAMDVDEGAGLDPGYRLKLNSYDLGVDIELYDAVQRLRFEHSAVRTVMITSAKDRVFCAGANIGMLGRSSHAAKVNFCKFTNETRLSIEDASANSGQTYMTVINGTAAGGGYELALATDHIMLIDDGSTAVSLPEVPLLAVLPGTGGLTRVVDKRHVRRDRADFFCSLTEGIRGERALAWNLVDELAPRSSLTERAKARAIALAAVSDRPADGRGIVFDRLRREVKPTSVTYDHLQIGFDRAQGTAVFTVGGPRGPAPEDVDAMAAIGTGFWPLALARELDDAILHLRFNEPTIGTWILKTAGDSNLVAGYDAWLLAHRSHWLVREILLYLKRTLKRLDVSSRSLIAIIEPGSCFAGPLLELALAADRSYMLDGTLDDTDSEPATIRLTDMNFGPLPMGNGLSRIESRMIGTPDAVSSLRGRIGDDLDAQEAEVLGLVTFAPDDIDWEDEVRVAVEERASFSPDALTGMEASLRFAGPETMETKIFGRLSAWQNWIFQRPNAVGAKGALKLFGSGKQTEFDRERV